MTDSGKHSALRQTDDGSFELVFDREGLQEVSEDDVSFAEVSAPEPQVAARTSNRVLLFSAIGVGVLLLIAGIGWLALAPSSKDDGAVEEVAGFKPYTGGADGADDSASKQAARRARLTAIAEAEEPLEDEVEVVDQPPEITESEPGWELSEQAEDGVIVEVEGTDALPEESGDLEVAEGDGEVVDEEVEPAVNARSLMPQKRLDALRNANLGRTIQAPRVPALSNNPLGIGRKLPIRDLQPAPSEDGESVDEELVDEEVIDEEVDADELE